MRRNVTINLNLKFVAICEPAISQSLAMTRYN